VTYVAALWLLLGAAALWIMITDLRAPVAWWSWFPMAVFAVVLGPVVLLVSTYRAVRETWKERR
jgi:hypothetical protein